MSLPARCLVPVPTLRALLCYYPSSTTRTRAARVWRSHAMMCTRRSQEEEGCLVHTQHSVIIIGSGDRRGLHRRRAYYPGREDGR
jgi:hypothetical protein